MAASLVQTSSPGVGGYPSANTSFSSTPTVGNVVFVTGFWNPTFGTEPTSISISDNQGNTYSAVVRSAVTQENGVFIGYCVIGTASGTFTVTATVTGGSADAGVALCLQEWSGMDTASLLDQSGSGTQFVNSSFSVSASGANSGDDRVVIAGVSGRGSDITPTNSPPDTGYTNVFARLTGGFGEPRGLASYKVVTASETSSADWGTISSGSGGSLAMVIATFAVEAGGGGDQTLSPSLVTRTRTLYAPTITVGSVTINPTLVTRSKTLFAPTVTPGAVTLSPGLVTRTKSLFSPTVTSGPVTISPGLLTRSKVIYAPTLTAGGITISPSLVTRARALYSPSVTPGSVTVSPPLISRTKEIFGPAVVADGTIVPPLVTRTKVLYAPTLTVGAVTVSPPLLTRSKSLFPPSLTQPGEQILAPGLLTRTKAIYAPTVSFAEVTDYDVADGREVVIAGGSETTIAGGRIATFVR